MGRLQKFSLLFLIGFCSSGVKAQLISGPMNGYSSMREVGIWLQLEEPGTIETQYMESDDI